MRSALPDRPDARPPYASLAAPSSGEALRPTLIPRPLVRVRIQESTVGYPAHDLYVRRFWSAVLGVSAVTELLRLSQAARRGRAVKRPIYLQSLMEAGLVHVSDGAIVVDEHIPEVPRALLKRLPVSLRYAHDRWPRAGLASGPAQGPPAGETECNELADHKPKGDPEIGFSPRKDHGTNATDQPPDPRAGDLTDRTGGDKSLAKDLGEGSGNDAGCDQGRHDRSRAKLDAKEQLDNGGADQPAHQTRQNHKSQAARGKPRH